MPKPVTPLVGCDVFITNEKKQVLLIRRRDNGMWALPGGCNDLGESAKECAERECREESGYLCKVTKLMAVFSSTKYEYKNYPWKENQFCHLVFLAEIVGGAPQKSNETTAVGWFGQEEIPPLSDGHDVRIAFGFKFIEDPSTPPYFE